MKHGLRSTLARLPEDFTFASRWDNLATDESRCGSACPVCFAGTVLNRIWEEIVMSVAASTGWNAKWIGRIVAAGMAALILATHAAAAPVIHVWTGGNDTGDGVTTPCQTVQRALELVDSGGEIRLAGGIYEPTTTINIATSVTLTGGYGPGDWTMPDPARYPTVLDARATDPNRNIRLIYIANKLTVTLRNLRLQNGNATGSNEGGAIRVGTHISYPSYLTLDNVDITTCSGSSGGGIYQAYGTLTIRGGTFAGNSARGSGGAILAHTATATIDGVTVTGNLAQTRAGYTGWGGGVNVTGTLLLSNSLIADNQATNNEMGLGGGVYVSGTAYLDHNTIQGNRATGGTYGWSQGGGVMVSGNAEIADCTVIGNTAGAGSGCDGGGMFLHATASNKHATARDCLVAGNTAGGKGGGIWFQTYHLTLERNVVEDNTASVSGGGIYMFGSTHAIRDNTVRGNSTGGNGGGIYVHYVGGQFDRNLILENSAADTGGGLYLEGGAPALNNTVVVDNTSSRTAGIHINGAGTPSAPISINQTTVARNTGGDGVGVCLAAGGARLRNTILAQQAIAATETGTGQLWVEHTLWDANGANWTGDGVSEAFSHDLPAGLAADGYHLLADSGAVDRGASLAGIADDIDGGPRPRGRYPDLGADESPWSVDAAAQGFEFSMEASEPHYVLWWDPLTHAPNADFEIWYRMNFAYGSTTTTLIDVATGSLEDTFPAALTVKSEAHQPAMNYTVSDNRHTWSLVSPLLNGDWGWAGLLGLSKPVPGRTVTNSAAFTGALADGTTFTQALETTAQVPLRPVLTPVLIWPYNGQIAPGPGGKITVRGFAVVGDTVILYEDGEPAAEGQTDAMGLFAITYNSAKIGYSATVLTARARGQQEPVRYSDWTDPIQLSPAGSGWCPQRSYWQQWVPMPAPINTKLMTYRFQDPATGDYVSSNWGQVPAPYSSFSEPGDVVLHLYAQCPGELPGLQPRLIIGSETILADESDGCWHTFTIPLEYVRQGVRFEADCWSHSEEGIVPGAVQLVDPDGYVFDVTQGFDPQSPSEHALEGVTVTCMAWSKGWGWIPWPAHLFDDQTNPQVTGPAGYFAFFTPPGLYYLQVDTADDYQPWRSPVVQVIDEIVHVNVPATPWITEHIARVALTPDGPEPSTMTIPAGMTVEWTAQVDADTPIEEVAALTRDPAARTLSSLNPLSDLLGWDSGLLAPGRAYRRKFDRTGVYTYTDGLGHTSEIVVTTGPDMVRDYLLGLIQLTPGELTAADHNNDSIVDVADIVSILNSM
jgi:parallel beta-helix repeat protein/predicted outer membrane repeat protein